jgi:hypothetical protein
MTAQRIPVPSAPGRKARTEQECRDFEAATKARIAVNEKRKELHDAIVRFVHANNGWVVSAPGQPIRIETPPDSDLIDKLADRGLDVQFQGTATRIEGKFLPVCIYMLHLPPLPR